MSRGIPSDPMKKTKLATITPWVSLVMLALLGLITFSPNTTYAEQPPPPCHPNPNAAQDVAAVSGRGDIVNLPAPLTERLARLADRPHSVLPLQVYAEADGSSQLFQYYLLDTAGFEPNVFTTLIPGINDTAQLTVTGGNCGLPTIGAVRVVLEPKPGLPTDPNNPRAFIDIFTDISGLFVINNESGWYEGWMIHDLTVPNVAPPRPDDGHAQFGTITAADAAVLKAMGSGNNVPGNIFTADGKAVRFAREARALAVGGEEVARDVVAGPQGGEHGGVLQQELSEERMAVGARRTDLGDREVVDHPALVPAALVVDDE